MVLDDPPNYEPEPETACRPRQPQRAGPWDLVYDLLIANDGQNILYTPFANYAENNLDCCRDMILHENTVMGLGDGGAHVGTICDASFITTLLTHWGRDRTRGERIDLPTLVKSQTHDTARAVDLQRSRHARAGHAGGRQRHRLRQLQRARAGNRARSAGRRRAAAAEGRRLSGHVCAGEVTYRNGEATDALPGRLIREGSRRVGTWSPLKHIRVLDLTIARAGPDGRAPAGRLGRGCHQDRASRATDGGSRHRRPARAGRAEPAPQQALAGARTSRSRKARRCSTSWPRADVIVENFRSDVKYRLASTTRPSRAINPRIIYASISGFGQDGPYATRPGSIRSSRA